MVADLIVNRDRFFQKLQDRARFSDTDRVSATVLYNNADLPDKVGVSVFMGSAKVHCGVHLPIHGTLPADQAVADATQRGLDELAHQILVVGIKALDAVGSL